MTGERLMKFYESLITRMHGSALLVRGPVFSRWFQMLIFGLWLDCVLEGFNLPKNDVAIFSVISL